MGDGCSAATRRGTRASLVYGGAGKLPQPEFDGCDAPSFPYKTHRAERLDGFATEAGNETPADNLRLPRVTPSPHWAGSLAF